MKVIYAILYFFHAVCEDLNTIWDEEGIHFSCLGYFHYKKKEKYEQLLNNKKKAQ